MKIAGYGKVLIGLVIWMSIGSGCVKPETYSGDEYLIKVGESVVTVSQFNNALEIAKTAYSHNDIQNPERLQSIRLQLLKQMIEELILIETAVNLGIQVSDQELETAEAAITEEFPDGTFELTLFENAIARQAWEKRLKTRLLMEKVIAQELESKVRITPEEIALHIKESCGMDKSPASTEIKPHIDALLIKRLRRQKAEEEYSTWIKSLRKEYPIEINTARWSRMMGKSETTAGMKE